MPDSVADNAQAIRDIQEELGRVVTLNQYLSSRSRAEAIEIASYILRDFGVQLYEAQNGEVALWSYDINNPQAPDPDNLDPNNNYAGVKRFVITTGS